MNERVTKLLLPIAPEQPCGPNLANDPRMDELRELLKGKAEVEIASVQHPAEPPDWKQLKGKAEAFLGASKHLGVAVMWTCAALQTEGLAGFRDGLALIKGLVEQQWLAVYPLLDPEDNNDPTQRLNLLGALTAPRGISGWLAIVDYLYTMPASKRKGAETTFEQLINPSGGNQITALPEAPALAALLDECLTIVKGTDGALTSELGAGQTISFEVLEGTLTSMRRALNVFVGGPPPPGESAGAVEEKEVVAGGAAARPIAGDVQSRPDVIRLLDKICAYYAAVEPASPVPYILRRARKMVEMDFVQAVQELNLATIDSLRPSMGSALEAAGAGAETTEPPAT